MNDYILSCTNLSVGYANKVVANEISFQVSSGDYLCIVGENGAGKSTLLKTLLGLQKPLSGKFTFKHNCFGYLPQQSDTQRDFPASVFEVVLSGNLNKCGWCPLYSRQQKMLAMETLDKLGISQLRNKCFAELSGGQQQRVLLARAICATSDILLLDEPVTGLDPEATNEMYDILRTLNKKDNITIIMITHNIEQVLNDATHVLHLSKKENFFGTVRKWKEYNDTV